MKTLLRLLRLATVLLVLQLAAEPRLQAQSIAPAGFTQLPDRTAGWVNLPGGIVAVVNERVILDWEVRERVSRVEELLRRYYMNNQALYEEKLREQLVEALDTLVEDQIILADAEKTGRQLSQEHLDRYIEGLIQTNYFGDSNRFLKALTTQDKTVEELREQHRRNDLVAAARQEKIANLPPATLKQIEEYYRSHEKEFRVEESARVSIITLRKKPIDTRLTADSQRKRAAEILAMLEAGQDFAELAKIYTEGSHPQRGGDYGWLERPTLRKELADVAFSLKPGELSEVIDTPEELYILRVADRRPAGLKPLTDVWGDIGKTVQAQERAVVAKRWLDQLRARTFIRYFGATPANSVFSQSRLAKLEFKHVGTSTVSDALIRARCQVREGEPVRRSSVDRDIRKLYATGDFLNIGVQATDADGGITLTYLVQERPVLSGIQFAGNKAFRSPELLRKLTSKTGERLDERRLFTDALAIESLYRKAGYPQAAVKYVVKTDERAGRGDVTFNITEQP